MTERKPKKKSRNTESSKPANRKRKPSVNAPARDDSSKPAPLQLIVGIGASAGGLEAFKDFFANMQPDSSLAFVLVQHLAPDHKSMLTELLKKATSMPVSEASDGAPVKANNVYVIPPNATMTIERGILHVVKPAPPREHRRPIDTFFCSLADDQGENAVCVVLSGTGSDGTVGLSAIKENGGFTIAQAEYDHSAMSGMPHSAVATGFVDKVLPVEDIPAELMSYLDHLKSVASRKETDGTRGDAAAHLATIARMVRARVGHDFSQYKEKSLTRRIQRRMQVMQTKTVPEYIDHLKRNPHELDLLFHELLIGVTRFFRDPQAFAVLAKKVVPQLLEGREADDAVRVWVPGCATGEEAYSIAILIRESMKNRRGPPVQIFATDIDESAVNFARSGRYARTTGLSSERLERWFTKDDGGYRPIEDIRNMCVFSVQSIIKDPPFSRLDLISCRNLLIYMDPQLQDRVIRTFNYALKPDAVLFLGPSEGVTRQPQYFTAHDKKHRIFQRGDTHIAMPEVRFDERKSKETPHQPPAVASAVRDDSIDRKARNLMEKHSPAYFVIDGNDDIIRFSGAEAGRYLGPSAGAASFNLFDMLSKSLRPGVRAAIRTAHVTNNTVVEDDVALRINGANRLVTVIVEPVHGRLDTGLCIVAFRENEMSGGERTHAESSDDISAVEHELRTVKTQLQSTIDELETANEEMKSATEEYQSVNEELQSSNEELETSKEEMQSINEELQTVNTEMAAKNEALNQVNSDIKNLLDSTEIATLFLDNELRVKSFTPTVQGIFHLRDGDKGRPITDIVTRLDYPELKADVREVQRSLGVKEREVQLEDREKTYILRIRPYRTVDNFIDGVVMTFVDITDRKRDDDLNQLILSELDHRVKNILAVVSSVITQSLRSTESPGEFASSIESRIGAIARAHSLLTQTGQTVEAPLRPLIEREIAPYRPGAEKITISGPDVHLTPRAGLTLVMAIHELASNAAKYGSLSTDKGQVSVTWDCIGTANERELVIEWVEADGPPVDPSAKRGFGTAMIDRAIKHDLNGTVKRDFLREGIRCSIRFPLNNETGRMEGAEETKSTKYDA